MTSFYISAFSIFFFIGLSFRFLRINSNRIKYVRAYLSKDKMFNQDILRQYWINSIMATGDHLCLTCHGFQTSLSKGLKLLVVNDHKNAQWISHTHKFQYSGQFQNSAILERYVSIKSSRIFHWGFNFHSFKISQPWYPFQTPLPSLG